MAEAITHLMIPALSGHAMQEADRATIEEIGIPGFTLMESAGRATVAFMEARYGDLRNKSIACFCGTGNNGGDALVVARQLSTKGAQVSVFLMAPPKSLRPDARQNLHILTNLAAQSTSTDILIQVIDGPDSLPNHIKYDMLIDGLLGTGVSRDLKENYSEVVLWMNNQPCPVVALDIPSGLHADTGSILGSAVSADLTVTMGALKAGLLLGNGPVCAGAVETAEIGIPDSIIRKAAHTHECAFVSTEEAVRAWLPQRKHSAHKYSVGMALVVAGSPGLTGAATLAATAAARSGAGAVVCAASNEIQGILANKLTEVMPLGLPSTDQGIDLDDSLKIIEASMSKARSLLVGCGLGKAPNTQQFVRDLIQLAKIPVVLDADGLNAVANQPNIISQYSKGQWILTPHLGEFRRLAGNDVDTSDLLSTVKHFAKQWNCILILKGAPTVVADSEGNAFINPIINPALATAGSGDVLAGLCAGFLAQGLSPIKSALTALYLGGRAVNNYTSTNHPATMLASDLIDHFCQIMNHFKA